MTMTPVWELSDDLMDARLEAAVYTPVEAAVEGLDWPDDGVDIVAEFCHYPDTGCEASESCLGCPLPRCKHDDPVWYKQNRRLVKDFQVMYAVQGECLSIEEAAERFSITVRTVFRILQRCRAALGETEGALAA